VHLAIEGLETALAERGIPSYPAPERAVRALSEASRYARWRREAENPGRVPEFEADEAAASRLLRGLPTGTSGAGAGTEADSEADSEAGAGAGAGAAAGTEADASDVPTGTSPGDRPAVPLAGHREARPTTVAATTAERSRSITLGADDAASLLGYYGIAVQPTIPAPGPDEAAAAARALGYPVALKTTAPRLRHRADLGGVRLDISSETGLRRAYAELTDAFGDAAELRPVVQSMAPRGVDTVIRAAVDPSIGAVLSFGLAGTPSELLEDVAHRLVPVTDKDAAELVRAIRSAPILFGWRGAQPVDVASLEELLLRVSRLLHDHPEIVAVDLEPVVVAPRGLTVLGATVRAAEPSPQTDLGRRSLPAY
jgi:acyl-CoA synthetase (NDP forming)